MSLYSEEGILQSEQFGHKVIAIYLYIFACFHRVEMFDCGDTAAYWLEAALGKPCRLLQQNVNFQRNCKFKQGMIYDLLPCFSFIFSKSNFPDIDVK